MNLLARLISHGFAISLVVLLAIGFIYRGELFPEWELPAFLVLDSDKDTSDDQLAGKVEPAPIKDDWTGSGTATKGQLVAELKDDSAGTDAAEGMPPVENVTEPGATAITESKSAVVDVAETVAKAGAGIPAAATTGAATVPVIESAVVNAVPAAKEAAEATVKDVVPASVEQSTISRESRDVAVALEKTPDGGHADSVAEAATSVTEATGVTGSTTASGAVGISKPQAAAATEDVASVPASKEVAEAAVEPVTAESGATGSGLADAPVAAPISAQADSRVPDSTTSQATVDSKDSSYQLLALAREAYWMRDYQVAEDYYRQMILNDPEDPDGYGELANMYFSQGNWEAAALAYYEAGSRLVKSGLLEPARELVDVIRGLKGPQADALEHEIETAQANSQ